MKKIIFIVGLVLLIFLCWRIAPTYYQSYQDNKIEAEQTKIPLTNGTIIISDKSISLPNMSCGYGYSVGGPAIPRIGITLQNEALSSNFNGVSFYVGGGEYENMNNLLKVGIHASSAGFSSGFSYRLSESTFSMPLGPRDMDIHIDSLSLNKGSINSASGYIHIKRKINFSCPEELEGVPGYKCTYRGEFLPIQKIGFSCGANG